MGDLKPIGSEKLQGDEKLRRIMEIARYNDTERSDMNVNETVDYTRQLADGKYYSIIHEKNGYIIKSGLNESEMTYDEPAENRRYHSSYSKALKKLNLIIKEMNILHENDEGLNLFGEQEKKFVLKTPKPEVEEPVMEPEMDLDLDMGSEGGEEEMDLDMDLDMDLGTNDEGGEEELDMDLDLDAESPAGEEEISIKEIQKLTGKLGQKLRTIDQQDGLSSEDIKYVLNSIISAVDLEKLTEEDKEDILENFEDDEIDYGVDDEADLDVDAGDELDLDMDLDMDIEEPMDASSEVGEKVIDEIFAESKIDKVLSKYFVISDEEKTLTESKNIKNFITEKIQKVTVRKEMKSMCETVEQELTANFLLKENKTIKFLGKTNKGNLVFENDGQQIKVSQKGELL
jgi:hypothetical protein